MLELPFNGPSTQQVSPPTTCRLRPPTVVVQFLATTCPTARRASADQRTTDGARKLPSVVPDCHATGLPTSRLPVSSVSLCPTGFRSWWTPTWEESRLVPTRLPSEASVPPAKNAIPSLGELGRHHKPAQPFRPRTVPPSSRVLPPTVTNSRINLKNDRNWDVR
ncbi:hypothetical protein PGT21_006863 [Puccinia graminis f. sp. tritici]|uniref:Uncharacterized protein n=1 Tax=Puccinia graminis f. sp. tritici TaxID=56615 RepID=A0A5B0M158_PUCGR|nr:hypothetical protein PGT21_006863 [Puccinia graminis f. sp. tritici]